MPPTTPPVPPAPATPPTSARTNRNIALAAFRAGESRRLLRRRIAIATGIVAATAVVALIVTTVVLGATRPTALSPSASASAPAFPAAIRGLMTFANTAGHVTGPVTYPQTPPAGGPHNQIWLNCGIYSQPVPNENAVHDLEHGAVWVTYDPSLPAATVAKLRNAMPSTYAVLSPYPGLPAPIVLSAWNAQVQVTSPTDARIAQFFATYRKSANSPEPGAPCTGGLDAPGKL